MSRWQLFRVTCLAPGDLVEPFPEADVAAVLRAFGITRADRSINANSNERTAAILLPVAEFREIDPRALEQALADVLPETYVWVTCDGPAWRQRGRESLLS